MKAMHYITVPIAVRYAGFGAGVGPIHMVNVGCYGYESQLQSCSVDGVGNGHCSHNEDAGVVCFFQEGSGDYY